MFEKLKNPFLWLWIIILISLSIAGYFIVNSYYDRPFPKLDYESPSDIKIGNEPDQPFTLRNFKCKSVLGYKYPVLGDEWECDISISSNGGMVLSNIEPIEVYLINYNPATDEIKRINDSDGLIVVVKIWDAENESSYSALSITSLEFPIQRTGINKFRLVIPVKNVETNKELLLISNFIPYYSVTPEEYFKIKNQRIGLLLSIITLSAILSLSGVRNLMEIWDREKN